MSGSEQITLRGEGGAEWTFDLPLSEVLCDQVVAGTLQPVDEESAALVAEYLGEGEGIESVEPAEDGGSSAPAEVTITGAVADEAELLAVDLDHVEATGGDDDHPEITSEDVRRHAFHKIKRDDVDALADRLGVVATDDNDLSSIPKVVQAIEAKLDEPAEDGGSDDE